MPSMFTVDDGFEVRRVHFNRFHLSEITGNPVKTKEEMPEDYVILTHDQAHTLVEKWNYMCSIIGDDIVYAVYDDVE